MTGFDRCKSVIIAMLMASAMMCPLFGMTASTKAPDFAYPEKVEKSASAALKKALKNGDGQQIVASLIQEGIARTLVNTDSLPSVVARIEQVEREEQNPATKALLNLLLADIYTQTYQSGSYRYNARETSATAGNDFRLWNQTQFAEKVVGLVKKSLENPEALQRIGIEKYNEIVDLDDSGRIFYPTLLDFVGTVGVAKVTSFVSWSDKMLNVRLLDDPTDSSLYPGRYSFPMAEALGIFKLLIDSNVDKPAPRFLQYVSAEMFISRHVFDDEPEAITFGPLRVSSDGSSDKLSTIFLNCYRKNSDSEFSAVFLEAVDYSKFDAPLGREVYGAMMDYLNRFPNSRFAPNIKNKIAEMQAAHLSAEIPEEAVPAHPFPIRLVNRNGKTVRVELFDVTSAVADPAEASSINKIPQTKPIAVKELSFDNEIPFNVEDTVELVLPKYGLYAVRLTVDGKIEEPGYELIRATDLTTGVSRNRSEIRGWVLNALTGAPIEGASFQFKPWSRRSKASLLSGVTDADGSMVLNLTEGGGVAPRLAGDIYAPYTSFYYGVSPIFIRRSLKVDIFTSLGLYRPGDKVEFAAVAYEVGDFSRKIAADELISIELRDANYSPIDTVTARTDEWGRISGEFLLPSELLTGNFTLVAFSKSEKGVNGYGHFLVSDYKLPDFEVETTGIVPPASVSSPALVSGRATAYSGFPVSNASVALQLNVVSRRWWSTTESPVFYSAETETDASGNFSFEIPAEVIASSPAPKGLFVCEMTVTSESGESHPLTAYFNLGKPLTITTVIPPEINLKREIEASAETVDALKEKVSSRLKYIIATDSVEVARGEVNTGKIGEILAGLVPGSYTIQFAPVDSTMADASYPDSFVVYNPDEGICPVDKHLWIPRQIVKATADGSASIVLGSNSDDTNVLLMGAVSPGQTVFKKWITLRKGMQTVQIPVDKAWSEMRVKILSVKNFNVISESMEVQTAEAAPTIAIVETFRDKVTPGDKEMIRISIRPSDGATALSAVMLDMANKAIDALAPNTLEIAPFVPASYSFTMTGFETGRFNANVSQRINYLTTYRMSTPKFNFYGYGFSGRYVDRYMMSSRKAVMQKNVALESVAEANMVRDTSYASAPMAAGAISADEAADSEMLDNGSPQVAEGKEENYRPSEIPLAFFRPMLSTKDDGTLELSYEVPDANTTWILRGLAYNKELQTALFNGEIVASKPVMVSLNAPRFVRSGDSLSLAASVMNNSDSAAVFNVVAEVLSSATGKVLFSESEELSLAAGGSAAIFLPVKAVESEPGLLFRVKASTEIGNPALRFSDGEQAFIPILPSQQDVVESEIFYLAPNQAQFTLDLPAMADGDRAYLNFTENPSWQVVSALPGLRESKVNSSLEAAAALFSAVVAEGIVKENPEIARVIRKWAESGDSALVSNLEKNKELKSMLLNSTPWVSEAMSETERMQRLVLLFDGKETARVRRDAIAKLAKCHVDGGWCWTEQYPAYSSWVTLAVLDRLGQLNKMGWLPADVQLKSMIRSAVEKLDREEAKDFAKNPKVDRWLYVAIRDCFPEYKLSTAASRVVEAQVQRSLANWKTADVPLKGVYAMILEKHGYHATALQVLASLREYSTSTPEKGMWWQQLDRYTTLWSFDRIGITSLLLDAFREIDPDSPDVDKIRQWLILNKTNNDWGNATMTTQAVASILRSGRPLKINTRGTAVHVGAALLDPPSQEYATGAFTENITPLLAEAQTLTVDRQADYPSVGAVVMMRTLPMDSIVAVGCKEVSVEKHLTVFDGKQWVPSDHFNIGDKVKVELVLNVEDDLSYVIIEDMRAAGLEPVEQLPRPIFSEGLCFYRENRDSQTNIFINFLPRGVYRLSYDLYASQGGDFASGAAKFQSQYNPIVAAHSGGEAIVINSK